MYNVKILKDSMAPCGVRLTTWELEYPRMVHSEVMTHRLFSRNAASSRAIPGNKLVQRVLDDPVQPLWWGKNQRGMSAYEELDEDIRLEAKLIWNEACICAAQYAMRLNDLGLHKQISNRIVEPWMFITVIVTATEFDNFFYLRDHKDAQPEIAWVAHEMRKLYDANTPKLLKEGEWHLPLVETEDDTNVLFVKSDDEVILRKISTARCARVSYLTHAGKRDLEADILMHDRLAGDGHWSPFEHPAAAMSKRNRSGNFIGWKQYRKTFENEHYGSRRV